MIDKKLNLKLLGYGGGASSLMHAFQAQARREHWDSSEIEAVLQDAMSKDYLHLIRVLSDHCNDPISAFDELLVDDYPSETYKIPDSA